MHLDSKAIIIIVSFESGEYSIHLLNLSENSIRGILLFRKCAVNKIVLTFRVPQRAVWARGNRRVVTYPVRLQTSVEELQYSTPLAKRQSAVVRGEGPPRHLGGPLINRNVGAPWTKRLFVIISPSGLNKYTMCAITTHCTPICGSLSVARRCFYCMHARAEVEEEEVVP